MDISSYLENYRVRLINMKKITFLLPVVLVVLSNIILNYFLVPLYNYHILYMLVRALSSVLHCTAYVFSILIIGPVSVYIWVVDLVSGLVRSMIFGNGVFLYIGFLFAFIITNLLYIAFVEVNNVFVRFRDKMYIVIIISYSSIFLIILDIVSAIIRI